MKPEKEPNKVVDALALIVLGLILGTLLAGGL